MKSSFDRPVGTRPGAQVETWKPDAIFPSLISEDTVSRADEILRLFQPATLTGEDSNPSDTTEKSLKRKSNIQAWELKDLSGITPDESVTVVQPRISGPSVQLGVDEKQRLINETRKHAEEILSGAQQTAAGMVEQARLEVEKIRQEAYAQGRAQASEELNKVVDNAQMILSEMQVWRQKAVQHSDDLIIDMIKKIAHLMFDEGVVLSNVALQRNLNKVMKMAQAIGDLRIYLNPKDLANLDPEWKRFQESLMSKKIQIIPADSIIPGGCYVQGEMGVVDAQVETQLAAVMEAFEPDPDKVEESPV